MGKGACCVTHSGSVVVHRKYDGEDDETVETVETEDEERFTNNISVGGSSGYEWLGVVPGGPASLSWRKFLSALFTVGVSIICGWRGIERNKAYLHRPNRRS